MLYPDAAQVQLSELCANPYAFSEAYYTHSAPVSVDLVFNARSGMDNPSKALSAFSWCPIQRIPESWNIALGGFVLEPGWDRLYF